MNTPGNNPGSNPASASGAGVTALTLKTGDKVDNYEIVQQVGAGGAGVVFAAYDAMLDRTVAIKQVVVPPGEEGDELRQRAVREAQAHRGVAVSDRTMLVQFIDVINDPRGVFLITEFVDGPTLEWILQSEPAPMEQRQALGIIAATAKGLASIHGSNMIHRDLKPSNILMPRGGGLKIADFGLAAALSDQQTMDLGSVRYMAPELLQGERGTTGSDMYSLGMIAYEMLAGRDKFNEAFRTILRDQRNQAMRWVKWHTNVRAKVTPLHTLVPEIPQGLSDLVARMMEKEPTRRIANTHELMEAIRMHFASGSQQGPIPTPQPHASMQPGEMADVSETAAVPKRSKVPMLLAGLLVFWIIAIGGYFLYQGQQRNQLYQDKVAKYVEDMRSADQLHLAENDYAASRSAFIQVQDKVRDEWVESPDNFKDEFANLGHLAAAGLMRADGMLAVDEEDYISALAKFEEYKKKMQEFEGDPGRLAQTTLTLAEAESLVSSYTMREAFQQNAIEISGLLDEGSLGEAIIKIRTQSDLGTLAEADQATLDALSARYRMLKNAARNAAVTEEAEAMVADGDLSDAIDVLEEAIAEDPEAAAPEHRVMLTALKLRVQRAESNAEIAEAERRGDTDDLIVALGERIDFDPEPEPFLDRYNALVDNRDANRAGALINDGQLNEADAILTVLLDRNPTHPLGLELRAGIGTQREFQARRLAAEQAFGSQNYDRAITLAQEAILIGGDRDNRMNEVITQSTGRISLAASETALENGDLDTAEDELDTARTNLGNTQQVLTLERQITELRDYRTLVSEGDVSFARGEYGRAKRSYLEAREIFSNPGINAQILDCEFYMWLQQCDSHIRSREWPAAEGALAQAERIKTNDETRQRRQQIEDRVQ